MKTKKNLDFKKKSNDQYTLSLYRQIKQSLVRIFNLNNENSMNESTFQLNKQNSDQLRMSQLGSFDQKRSIIRVKENALLEDLREKLQKLSTNKWKALSMKEKLDILLDLMASFKIIQQRITFLGQYENKFGGVYIKQKMVKEISQLREIIQNQTNKEKQSKNNSRSKFANSQMTYSSSLTVTRPSSCNLTSHSRLFMQNYIKSKIKSGDQPNIKNKFYSHHFQSDEKDNFIINQVLKQTLNNRNTVQCKLKDKSIKEKSGLIQELNGQQIRVESNESSEERISLSGLSKYSNFDQKKSKHKKINSYDQNIETNKRVKSRHEGKMVRYDQEEKQRGFQSAYLIKQQTQRREKDKIKSGKYIRTEAFTKQVGYNRKYSLKRKIKRGNKRNKRVNQSRFSIQNTQPKEMPQTKKSLDIQPTQNEQEIFNIKSQKQSKVKFIQNFQFDQNDFFQEKMNEQPIQKSPSPSQIKIIGKENKILVNSTHKINSIKRNAVVYRKQEGERDKTQTNIENIKNKSVLTNIFDDLHELQREIRKQNEKYSNDMIPVFYQDQEIIQKIEQKRLFRLFKRTPISSEQLVKSFKMFCSQSSYRILNIKQYERLYSFMSDNEWIQNNFFNKNELKILQKNLDSRLKQIN